MKVKAAVSNLFEFLNGPVARILRDDPMDPEEKKATFAIWPTRDSEGNINIELTWVPDEEE